MNRRAFLSTSAAILGSHMLPGCTTYAPASQRRLDPASPLRRPRRVLALTRPGDSLPATEERLRSPLHFGERVAGLYPGDTMAPWVNLTFDDGPRPDWTNKVLRLLADHGVTATFFVVGRLAAIYPDIIKRIVDEGHVLGNHTYSHANLALLTEKEIEGELDRAQESVDKALGQHHPMPLVRPPFGSPWFGSFDDSVRDKVASVINRRNGFCILWHIGTSDTRPDCSTSQMIRNVDRAIEQGRGGSMVLHPSPCAKQSIRSVLRLMEQREVATATCYHLLEAKYNCAWTTIASLPTKLG